jgi:hypothetical protein
MLGVLLKGVDAFDPFFLLKGLGIFNLDFFYQLVPNYFSLDIPFKQPLLLPSGYISHYVVRRRERVEGGGGGYIKLKTYQALL